VTGKLDHTINPALDFQGWVFLLAWENPTEALTLQRAIYMEGKEMELLIVLGCCAVLSGSSHSVEDLLQKLKRDGTEI
jgi:hypothetical protein